MSTRIIIFDNDQKFLWEADVESVPRIGEYIELPEGIVAVTSALYKFNKDRRYTDTVILNTVWR